MQSSGVGYSPMQVDISHVQKLPGRLTQSISVFASSLQSVDDFSW